MAGIYIHIPFCKQKCGYCDFYSITDLSVSGLVLRDIRQELVSERDFLGDEPIETIYIGGGTPSTSSPEELGRLIKIIRENYDCNPLSEVTVEVNPDDLNTDYLARLAQTGINRLSIGIQSFIDRDLQFMNRRHSAQAAIEAVRQAQAAGFRNITIDLIYGIPGMSNQEWLDNLNTALSLGVQHISAYHLGIEPGTPFHQLASSGRIHSIDEEVSREQFEMLRTTLGEGGFEHYEISNFALPGFRGLHNSNYWKGRHYLGVGPSAHSFDSNRRCWNKSSVGEYLAGNCRQCEELTQADKYNEFVMLSLRTTEGADRNEFESRFGNKIVKKFMRSAEGSVACGSLIQRGSQYAIPASEFLTADAIIGGLFEV